MMTMTIIALQLGTGPTLVLMSSFTMCQWTCRPWRGRMSSMNLGIL